MTTFQAPVDFDQGPVRTSIAAIIGLVIAIIGLCVPGAGLLGALLGLVAFIGISGSDGRVGGRGLAIAAIVIGLLFFMINSAVVYGGYQSYQYAMKMMLGPGQVAADIHNGNYAGARSRLDASVQAQATDEALKKFHDAVTAEMGAFTKAPQGFMEWTQMLQQIQPLLNQNQNVGGGQPNLPIPIQYEKGVALFLFEGNPQAAGGDPASMPASNLTLITPSNTVIELFPSGTPAPTATPTPTPTPTPNTNPAPAPTPTPDPKADPAPVGG